ncbi:hypothetical protein [Streptomyces sp. A244]|uniref:hypothetical protein n=1 Tax=Streptomyces sp. A244 TaxID=2137016 RepID=UPI0011B256E6|nr:hypothetical protein [Streptomyces sp. A244]
MGDLKNVSFAFLSGVARPKAFTALGSIFALLSLTLGYDDSGRPSSGYVSNTAQSRDSRQLIKWPDARRLLDRPVGPPVLANPDAVPDLPGCPAYARLADDFYQRIDYESDEGIFLSEFVTEGGGDTQNLEDLQTCSKERGDGAVVEIQVHRVPGGPGNVNGAVITDGDWEAKLRARVVAGANVLIVTEANDSTADEAISVAVARWGGTALPQGYGE